MNCFSRKIVLIFAAIILQSSLGTTYALADLSNAISVNLSLNGYAKFNNGLLVQWGRVGGSSTAMERIGEDEEEKNEDVYAVQLRPQAWKCMLCGLRVQTKMQE